MAGTREDLSARLADIASRHLGGPVVIDNLQPLSGGASADTWQFDASCDGKNHALILRLAAPGADQDPIRVDRSTEAKLQQLAAEAGVPVAPVVFILEHDDGLGPGYAMERIDGETLAPRILREEQFASARQEMATQCGHILARIHSIDPKTLPRLRKLPAEKILIKLYELYSAFNQKHPVFELAFKWLENRMPAQERLGLVHGDFRNGNFIVGPDGIRAVLDWEVAHLGDPMEDLGWICVNSWRFGNIDLPVGGFGHREQLFEAYEKSGGGSVNPESVHFWEVFGTLKWGVVCIIQAFTHLMGAKRSVELATIGRRVSETEIDLLNLLT
jgi:aminoglycoside phosphotransferase (APT) family kinase protein